MIKFMPFFAVFLLLPSLLAATPKKYFHNQCLPADNIESISPKELNNIVNNLKKQRDRSSCRDALLGHLQGKLGKYQDASRYFSQAAQSWPELADYFLLAQAQALFSNKDLKQAAGIAEKLLGSKTALESRPFNTRIKKILADLAFTNKDHQHIIKTHQELLSQGCEDPLLLFNLASSLIHENEPEKAAEIFKQLFVRFPLSLEAKQSEKITGPAPLYLNQSDNEKRFDQLTKNLALDRVAEDVDSLLSNKKLALDPEQTSRLENFAIKSLILNNRFSKGIERAKKRALSLEATSGDLENYAWALGKVDRFSEASHYYLRFSKKALDKNDQAKGCFFAGFSLYEASLYDQAHKTWQQCQGTIEGTSFYENYLWYQALLALLNNNLENADRGFAELIQKFNKSPEHDKYVYFAGYSSHQMNKKNEGNAHYRTLINNKRPGYYVMLAQKSLGLNPPKARSALPDLFAREASSCIDKHCQNIFRLSHLGFKEDARDLLMQQKMPESQKLSFLQYIGDYHEPWQRSYLLKPELSIDGQLFKASTYARAAYPKPYVSIVDTTSRKYNLDKHLLYAIISIESGFKIQAVSYRGARGLMQMMPFVASDLKSTNALQHFTGEKLEEPQTAIELGTLLLATLKSQFGNDYLAVAAYNAGAHQVQKWQDRFGHLPTPLFIERIPFEQTRKYIKKVLTTSSIYAALDGQALKLAF